MYLDTSSSINCLSYLYMSLTAFSFILSWSEAVGTRSMRDIRRRHGHSLHIPTVINSLILCLETSLLVSDRRRSRMSEQFLHVLDLIHIPGRDSLSIISVSMEDSVYLSVINGLSLPVLGYALSYIILSISLFILSLIKGL